MIRVSVIISAIALIIAFSFSCKLIESGGVDERLQTIEKGNHSVNWYDRYISRRFKKHFDLDVRFLKNVKYDYGDIDNLDKNKLSGVFFSLNPHKNACLEWWRYVPERDVLQVGFYYHTPLILPGKQYFEEHPATNAVSSIFFVEVAHGDTFNIHKSIFPNKREQHTRVETEICTKDTCIFSTVYFRGYHNDYLLANFYHGGNRTAQQTETVHKKLY